MIRTLVDGLEATVITIESLPKASRSVHACSRGSGCYASLSLALASLYVPGLVPSDRAPINYVHSYVKNCPDIRKRVYSFRKEELPPDEEQEQEQGEEHDHPDAAWEAVLQQVAELCDTGDAAWSLPGSWSAPTSPTAPRPPLPMLIPQLSAPPFGALTLPPLACIPTGAGLEEGEAILEAKGAEGVSALFTPGSHFHAWGRMKNTPTTL